MTEDPLRDLPNQLAAARLLLGHALDCVAFLTREASIVWISPAVERIFGIRAQDLIGRDGFELISASDLERVRGWYEALEGMGASSRIEARAVLPDGEERWIEGTATNLLDDPDVGYVVATIRDVTARREAEAELAFRAQLLGAVGEAVIATDVGGRVTYWNAAAERLYGWSADEAVGRPIEQLTVVPDGAADAAGVLDELRGGRPWSGDSWVRRRDGSTFLARVTNTPVLDPGGALVGIIGVSSDLTERLGLLAAHEADRQRLAEAQRSAHLGSWELHVPSLRVTWSEEFLRILGLPEGAPEPAFAEYLTMVHPDDRGRVARRIARVRADAVPALDRGQGVETTYRVVRPGGEVRWVLSRMTRSLTDPDTLTGTVLDITERREAELRLAHQATHDPLTDLPNRTHLMDHLDRLLRRRERGGPPVAMSLVDLDRFKYINDGLGHHTGDKVLLAVARRLVAAAREGELVGRFGGDEFVVISAAPQGADSVVAAGERLVKALEQPIVVDRQRFFLTASIGVVVAEPGDSAATLLQAADTAMYAAKRSSGRRVRLYDHHLRTQTRQRLTVEADLRQALEEGGLAVHYQPIIRLSDGSCAGFEALLRWDHPRLGPMDPSRVVPVAEDTGLIIPVGEWLLDAALAQLRRWHDDAGDQRLWVAVNLSAHQLAAVDLADQVAEALERAGVPPSCLHLEITEGVVMERIEAAEETLESLRLLGVHLSVDDFGTGYSSLSYLKRLPVQSLKIDRSFVAGLGEDPSDTSIVQAVAALGEALGLDVVAEGVETRRQLAAIGELHCHLGQGYLWSRPLDPAAATDWLRTVPPPPAQVSQLRGDVVIDLDAPSSDRAGPGASPRAVDRSAERRRPPSGA